MSLSPCIKDLRFYYINRFFGVKESTKANGASHQGPHSLAWQNSTFLAMVNRQRRAFSRTASGLLSVMALLGAPGPSKADIITSIGSNGAKYEIEYDSFTAPDSASRIDARLKNTSWWGKQGEAVNTSNLLQTPLGAAYSYTPLFVGGTYNLCYWEGVASTPRCIGRRVDDLILNYQAVPTTTNPNVSGAATAVLASSPGPQQPLATGLGQGVSGFVVTGLSGQPTVIGATSNADFNGVLAAVNALPTQAAVNDSYQQVIAEPYASYVSIGLETLERFRQDALDLTLSTNKIYFNPEADACSNGGRLNHAAGQTAEQGANSKSNTTAANCSPGDNRRWALLLDASNTQASLQGTNGLASLDYHVFQSTYGLEYQLSPNWQLGGVFGYGQNGLSNYEFSNVAINADTYSGGLYGIYSPAPAWKVAALAGYTNFQNRSNRPIQFGTINRTAQAQWSGNGFSVALSSQYDWILNPAKAAINTANGADPNRDAVRIKPRALLSYAAYNQGSISESGANSLNLAVNSHTADSLVLGLGGTLEAPIRLSKQSRLIPRLTIGYEYDAMGDADQEHQLTASFSQVQEPGSLTLLGQNRGANALDVALGIELEASAALSLYADVGGSFWSNGNELNYGGGLRWRFGGAPRGTTAQVPATVAPLGQQ